MCVFARHFVGRVNTLSVSSNAFRVKPRGQTGDGGHCLRSLLGRWTPKAVMKTLTTTMTNTKAVVRFSKMFNL